MGRASTCWLLTSFSVQNSLDVSYGRTDGRSIHVFTFFNLLIGRSSRFGLFDECGKKTVQLLQLRRCETYRYLAKSTGGLGVLSQYNQVWPYRKGHQIPSASKWSRLEAMQKSSWVTANILKLFSDFVFHRISPSRRKERSATERLSCKTGWVLARPANSLLREVLRQPYDELPHFRYGDDGV